MLYHSNTPRTHISSDFGSKETVDYLISGENFSAFAACGDNNVHHVDLEYGKVKLTFSGHTDFIHSMSQMYVLPLWILFTVNTNGNNFLKTY